jgi:outer membrane protein assembly factor BamB
LDEGPGAGDFDIEFARSHSPFMGIEWNVTLPDVYGSQGEILVDPEGGLLIANAVDTSEHPFVHWDTAYDIGAITRNSNYQYPSSINHLWTKGFDMINDVHNRRSENLRDGYYIRFDEGAEIVYCIDARTGNIRWQSESYDNVWGLFSRIYLSAYNTVTTSGFDGIIRNWDADTGELRFAFSKGSAGFENAYGTYPEYAGLTIADGTIYCTADEHSSDGILWRGAQMWAINIETVSLSGK